MLREPLRPADARKLLREIIVSGSVGFTGHALSELAKDGLTTVDALNVLRGGVFEPAELEKGSWRYRVRTPRMYVVVAFRAEDNAVVVTAWKVKK